METMSLEQQLVEMQAALCAEMGQLHPLFAESWYWEPLGFGYWGRLLLEADRGEKYFVGACVERELDVPGSDEDSTAGLWRWELSIVPDLPYERDLDEEILAEGCSYGAYQGILAVEEALKQLYAAGLQLS